MPREMTAQVDALVTKLAQQSEELVKRRGLLTTPLETLEVEQEIAALGREFSDGLMALLLVSSIEERQEPTEAAPSTLRALPHRGPGKTRAVGRPVTPIRLLGGREVSVKTSYRLPVRTKRPGRRRGVGRRGKAGAGYFPHLVALGILCGATPAVLSETSRQVAESSSLKVAQENLKRRGLELGEKTLTRLSQGMGKLALHLREARVVRDKVAEPRPQGGPARLAGQRVVAAVDGGRMRIRQARRRGRRRKDTRHRGFDAPWREPKVLVVYTIDGQGKKERHRLSLYDATLEDANAVFALLVSYLRLLGVAEAAQLALLGDGARWIWGREEELLKALNLPAERFVAIVDYYHAVEHLGDVAELLGGWTPRQRRVFVRTYKEVLRRGGIEELVAAIDELCVGRNATALATERDYFARNAERMRYADFEQRGLPLGSGAVESAVRQVVNQRLKSNGMFWLQARAEHMLHLRAFLRAGRWDQLVLATLAHHCALTDQELA